MIVNLVVAKLDQAGRGDFGNRVDITCRWAFPLAFVAMNAANAAYFLTVH